MNCSWIANAPRSLHCQTFLRLELAFLGGSWAICGVIRCRINPKSCRRLRNVFSLRGCLHRARINGNLWTSAVGRVYLSYRHVWQRNAVVALLAPFTRFWFFSRFRMVRSVLRCFSLTSLHNVLKYFLTNWRPLSVSIWTIIRYEVINWSKNKFATWVALVCDVRIAVVILDYLSVITMANKFWFIVCSSGQRTWKGIYWRGPVVGNSCKSWYF